jgi:hypothetical protein
MPSNNVNATFALPATSSGVAIPPIPIMGKSTLSSIARPFRTFLTSLITSNAFFLMRCPLTPPFPAVKTLLFLGPTVLMREKPLAPASTNAQTAADICSSKR